MFRDGRVVAVPYGTQEQLRTLLDQWGHLRMVYHTHATLHAVIHCPSSPPPVSEISVVVNRGAPDAARLRQLLPWMDESGYAASYVPMRAAAVPPQPNSGSNRTAADIARWCDGTVDALTRFHVIVNVKSPTADNDNDGSFVVPVPRPRPGQHV